MVTESRFLVRAEAVIEAVDSRTHAPEAMFPLREPTSTSSKALEATRSPVPARPVTSIWAALILAKSEVNRQAIRRGRGSSASFPR